MEFKDLMDAEKQAKEEFEYEQFRERVEQIKQQYRDKKNRPWYVRLFPWRITIIKF
jgi:hypothetical protein